MPLVILGYGNVSRGDDSIGPLLLARVEQAAPANTVTIEDFQLQIEHALDLCGADLVLFLDAGTGTPAPFAFTAVEPVSSPTLTSHALLPETVLEVYVKVMEAPPPPAFVLCVRGESFKLGDGLSAPAADHLEAAWRFLQDLLAKPEAARWRDMVTAA